MQEEDEDSRGQNDENKERNIEKRDETNDPETLDENLQELWKNLVWELNLDLSTDSEQILLELEDERVKISQGEKTSFKFDKTDMPESVWGDLMEWFKIKQTQNEPTVMPKRPPEGIPSDSQKDEERERKSAEEKKERAYIYDAKLPQTMWDLATTAAVYAYNRTPHKSNDMITPLQKFAPEHNFNINQIKRFGCLAYIRVQRKTGPKFRAVGVRVILVGYTPTGYQFIKPEDGKYYESRHARFNEKLVYGDKYQKDSIKDMPKEDEVIDDGKWFVNLNPDQNEMREMLKTEGETIKKRGRPKRKAEVPTKSTENETNDEQIVHSNSAELSTDGSSNKKASKPCYMVNKDEVEDNNLSDEVCHAFLANISSDPGNYKEAMNSKDKEEWKRAINEELNSMEKNQVWKLIEKPTKMSNGRKLNLIDSRWVFKRKMEPNGTIRYKARLVIRGFKDRNVYELSETYAPVSRLTLVRVVISIINKYDLDVCQLDVKTAFLNGELEDEIFMEIPDGVNLTEKEKRNKVCKLERALYGLRVSPKRWNEKFTQVALSLGLENSDLEPCLFNWRDGDKFLILLLYVDDILLASNDKDKLEDVKTKLSKQFEMTVIGEPKEFLSISIRRDRVNHVIELSQEKYIQKMLTRFGFDESHPQKTPMTTNQVTNQTRKLKESETDGEIIDQIETKMSFPYREAVGSLLYLAGATRPDVTYAVNVLSRHQINPTAEDWAMVKRVFRYLRGTMRLTLRYTGESEDIQAHSDASFADCKDSLTTCGFLIKLFGDTIIWKTRKQKYVALSTCQAEYVAMSETSQEMLSVYNSLKLILIDPPLPMTLWCDNNAAIAGAETNGGNRLRHIIDVKAHHIKECVKLKLVVIKWVRSKDQLADIFTKPLAFQLHKKLVDEIMNAEIK